MKSGIVAVGSSLEEHDGEVFNTARVYERGELRGSYRKIHLFSPNLEHRHHAPGDEPCVVETELGTLPQPDTSGRRGVGSVAAMPHPADVAAAARLFEMAEQLAAEGESAENEEADGVWMRRVELLSPDS